MRRDNFTCHAAKALGESPPRQQLLNQVDGSCGGIMIRCHVSSAVEPQHIAAKRMYSLSDDFDDNPFLLNVQQDGVRRRYLSMVIHYYHHDLR